MHGYLLPEETELLELTDNTLHKLCAMTDAEFDSPELYPGLISKGTIQGNPSMI